MATNTNEVEMLRKAIKLLHSPHPNSATELRLMLDEAIKQRYGPEHMISHNMNKRLMEEEANFPGRAATPPPPPEQPPPPTEQDPNTLDEVINLTGSPAKTISDSPDTIMDSDDGANVGAGGTILTGGDDDVNLKEFGDLNCAVCGEMVFTATNRLIECSTCGTLYHQECHKPPITDEEASEGQEHNWQCDNCLNKPSTSKAAGIIVEEPMPLVSKTKSSATSSRSSSTSNSSSPFPIIQQDAAPSSTAAVTTVPTTSTSTSSSSRHHHHKSSKSHKDERPSSSSSKTGSSSSAVNPTFNVISASERSSTHSSKKSSSHSSSSSKSSSSKSSSSKHHESSKRKAK